ncbi:MAG: IS21 family transposase, partial [Pseudomonadales bacterium]|nr:IS21 family transposase [Pseudomonadales bacterium]
MPATRIAMRKIREVLRLRLEAGLSFRQISASTKVSVGAAQKVVSQVTQLGLKWPLSPSMDDSQLAKLFYPTADTRISDRMEVPDWRAIHQELKRKGITKLLLWEEYSEQYPNRCYSYSRFCEKYRRWRHQQRRSMRQTH